MCAQTPSACFKFKLYGALAVCYEIRPKAFPFSPAFSEESSVYYTKSSP